MSNALKLFDRRKNRVRNKLRSVGDRPRLTVFRSNQHVYAQIIDDKNGVTLVSASTLDKTIKTKKSANINTATQVGNLLASKAVKSNITDVVFDRGGYLFHGTVKALADAAREGGLKF